MERTTTLTRSPYDVLEINRWAGEEVIKDQYFTLTKKYNPEFHQEKWVEIRQAFEILRDPSSRANTDVRIFTGPPEIKHADYPDREHYPHSLFKLNQEMKALLGEGDSLLSLQGEARDKAIHILHGMALYHVLHNQFEEARAIWKQALELKPDDTESEQNSALSLWQEAYQLALDEKYDQAEKGFLDLIDRGIQHGALYQDLALTREKMGKKAESEASWSSALDTYKKDLKADSDNEYLKALVLAIHKYTGGKFLESGASSNKDFIASGSAKDLGYACIQKGNWKQAVEALEQALRDNPNDVDVLCQLGWAYLNTSQHAKAFQMWNMAQKKSPGKNNVVDHLVRGYTVYGKRLKDQRIYNQALVQFKNALKYEPGNLAIRMTLAETFFQMKNFAASVAEYQKILDIDPRHKEAKQGIREAKRLGGMK